MTEKTLVCFIHAALLWALLHLTVCVCYTAVYYATVLTLLSMLATAVRAIVQEVYHST